MVLNWHLTDTPLNLSLGLTKQISLENKAHSNAAISILIVGAQCWYAKKRKKNCGKEAAIVSNLTENLLWNWHVCPFNNNGQAIHFQSHKKPEVRFCTRKPCDALI